MFRLDFSRLSFTRGRRYFYGARWEISSGRAEAKQGRLCSSIHSKYKFTQLTQFERTSRGALRSYLLPVHGSTAVQLHRRRRIVHQSSDQVCVPRHNIVVLSLHLAPSLSRLLPFPDKGENRLRDLLPGVNQCDSILSSLFLASSFFHLRRTTFFLFFLSYLNFSVIARFYPPSPRILILFSLHLYASAIITGGPTAQIFNLVWQMADLETRGTSARRDKRRRGSSTYVRSCEPRKFPAG